MNASRIAATPPRAIDVFLNPGEFFVGDARHRVRTLLGSCVAITLWHPRWRIGAMSHFLLSRRGGPASRQLDARYGEESLQLMLGDLARRGVAARECEAKLFGGGDMFPSHGVDDTVKVGRRNGEAAHRLLDANGIAVVAESLFGVGHRQIVFDVGTGHVWSRRVDPEDANSLPTGAWA